MIDQFDCDVKIKVVQSDIPLSGNVVSSGDDESDKKSEKYISDQLEKGNVWAWCDITVVMNLNNIHDANFSSSASLSGCSYENEEEFKKNFYIHLQNQCLRQLNDAAKTILKYFTECD